MKLLLFSGGVESTCLAYLLRPDLLLTIDYGQKSAEGEIRASSFIAKKLNLRHEVVVANINQLGTGDLAGRPSIRHQIATEFWPFRNQFLITLAAMKCARENYNQVLIGTVSTDVIHADGSLEFILGMNRLLQQQMPDFTLDAPAANIDTFSLIEKSQIPKDLLGWTFSCYTGSVACGQCRGCNKTLELQKKLQEKFT